MAWDKKGYHRIYKARIRKERQAWMRAYKVEAGCRDCGYHAHHAALEFDHCRGIKVADVGALASRCASIERMLEEIALCDVVCANCHNVREFLRRNN